MDNHKLIRSVAHSLASQLATLVGWVPAPDPGCPAFASGHVRGRPLQCGRSSGAHSCARSSGGAGLGLRSSLRAPAEMCGHWVQPATCEGGGSGRQLSGRHLSGWHLLLKLIAGSITFFVEELDSWEKLMVDMYDKLEWFRSEVVIGACTF